MDRSDAAIRAEFCLQGSVEPTPSSYVTSFSTGDIIEGIVTICARNNTRFHDINISLLGMLKSAECADRSSSPTSVGI
jgi:hypothetical protein